MISTLEQSILATLVYFDIFEYPLTLFEIGKNLINNVETRKCLVSADLRRGIASSLQDIESALNSEELKNKIGKKNGFYFLKGSDLSQGVEPIMARLQTRHQRYFIADKKFKKAKRIVWLLSKIPYIKMIAVCNSLGYSNATENSDIDFFIITAKNKIWISRLLAVILIKFLNLRPKSKNIKDKICLSFFIDEENLNLEKFKIGDQDIYLTYWTTQLVPIFDRDEMYNKFWEQNKWVEKYLPNRIKYEIVDRRKVKAGITRKLTRNKAEVNWLEKLVKKTQLKFLNPKLKELMNKDTRVVINDGVLKLYAVDRREEYFKKWVDSLFPLILSLSLSLPKFFSLFH